MPRIARIVIPILQGVLNQRDGLMKLARDAKLF